MHRILIILDLEVLVEETEKIGNPYAQTSEDPMMSKPIRRELTEVIVFRSERCA